MLSKTKAFLSLALLYKVGQYAIGLATGTLDLGPSVLYAVVAVITVTSGFALILLGLLMVFLVNTRMLRSILYLVVYVFAYRPLHITVKIAGFLWAFFIESVERGTVAVKETPQEEIKLTGTQDD